MDTLVKNVGIALRPLGAVRDRLATNTLTIGPTLVTLILVIVACNAWIAQAQTFYLDSLQEVGFPKTRLRDHPLLSDFSRYMSLAVTTFTPLCCVGLLPRSVFAPENRAVVTSAVMVALTASSFYTLLFYGLAFYFGGLFILIRPPDTLFAITANPYVLVGIVLLLFAVIWLNIAVRVLAMHWRSASLIGIVFCSVSGGLYWLYFAYVGAVLQVQASGTS